MDVYGKALTDYYLKGKADILWLHNSYDEPEEMPVEVFFRTGSEMPELEILALEICEGKILDIGAGTGSHALMLQRDGKQVTAMDISADAVEIMKGRGVKTAINGDIFEFTGKHDTLLLLMNGIGLTGSLPGFANFLDHAKTLLNEGGQLLFDSSDIAYLYQDGLQPQPGKYYGEVSYKYSYQGKEGAWFDWLYIDQETLKRIAAEQGWHCDIRFDDGEDQYLAQLHPIS